MAFVAAGPTHADDAPGDLVALVGAATQRLQVADSVAASKWLSGAPITDPPRVRQVLDDVAEAAVTTGLPTDYVTAVFTDQIDATEAVQYARFAGWKFDPPAAPVTAPDLAASRAVIDEMNKLMVSEIARDWPVLTGPHCAAALRSAKDVVAQQRTLDALYRQALDAATRSYCR